ncbi:MAG: PQQ-binding-like beta-propeller repeat protein [Pirellulales bacterium]
MLRTPLPAWSWFVWVSALLFCVMDASGQQLPPAAEAAPAAEEAVAEPAQPAADAKPPAAADKPADKPAADKPPADAAPAAAPPPPPVKPPAVIRRQIAVPAAPNIQIQVQGRINGVLRARMAAPGLAIAATGANGEEPAMFARDRDTEQLLKKARELLEEERYAEAVRALGAIVEAPEDFFFQPDADGPVHRSLKAEAQKLIGELPRVARETYELQYGARAAQRLAEALDNRDFAQLTEVSRRFFHTEAGYRATYLLAQHHRDHGRPLAAALCFERLLTAPAVARQWEPQLSLALASCWMWSGATERARDVLVALKQQQRDAQLIVAGEQIAWFDSADEATTWLTEKLGVPPKHLVVERADWLQYRGDAARNAPNHGSSPLLDHESDCWWVPTTEDHAVETQLAQLRQKYRDEYVAAIPGLHPLVVDNVVLMRTVSTLLAIDFETGKRVWDVPVDESLDELLEFGNANVPNGGNQQQMIMALDQRLWDDLTFGTLSSDGRYVFSVEDLSLTLPNQPAQARMVVLPNGRKQPAPVWPRNFNRLTAHDIRTGKLKWEAGGTRGDFELEMAGAFFLGPPLPLGDAVYALAEINGEIRLAVLDARSGQVQWSQQLAVVELDVLQDPTRRLAGVAPSYSDGVLVCPTASGAIVAVDLTTRSLLWGYRYDANPAGQNQWWGRRVGAMMMFAGRQREEIDHWLDSSVTLAAGRVLATPVESNELHCLGLLDGEVIWKQPRGDNLYVAGVHQGKVILVGRSGVQALKVDDGQPAWSSGSVPLPTGSLPSGRGFLSGDRYYLPLSSAEVAAIDLNEGRIVARSKSRKGRVPGNLVCYRGKVLSQGIDVIESYYELDSLKRQVDEILARKPDDPTALAQRGTVLLHDGQVDRAVADLRRSFLLSPQPRTREHLVDSLLEALAVNFSSYREASDELERLVRTPDERSRYLRLMASGLSESGDATAAVKMYLQLADRALGPPTLERVESARSVRRDRWTQTGLAALTAGAPVAQQTELTASIERLAKEALASDGPDALRHFIQYFGDEPSADLARDQLAQRLVGGGNFLEAEFLWRRVERSGQAALARRAVARLALLMKTTGRSADAARYARRLASEFAKVECLDGKTGRELAADLRKDPAIARNLASSSLWPLGRVEIEREDRRTTAQRFFQIEFSAQTEPGTEGLTVALSQDNQALVGRDGNGQDLWRASLADPSGKVNHVINRAVMQARCYGHLVLVSLGQQIIAIDTFSATGPGGAARVIWTQDLSESLPGIQMQTGVHQRQIDLPWGQRRWTISDSFGRAIGQLGPLSGDLFCFQRNRELVAIDPVNGQTLWIRHNVEPGCEIFGDDQYVFVIAGDSREALVLDALDGRELGKRLVPPANERVVSVGRNLLTWEMRDGRQWFQMFDLWEQREEWRHSFAGDAKCYHLGQDVLGAVEPSGRFVAVQLSDGRKLVDSPIEPEPQLQEIYVLMSRERLYLFTNRPWANHQDGVTIQPVPGLPTNPLLNGLAYGFDLASGEKLWHVPIEKQSLTLDQPQELPVLVFAARVYERPTPQNSNNREPYTTLLCIDKRTGKVLHQERVKSHLGMYELISEPANQTVELKLPQHSLRMKFTDKPEPPPEAAAEAAEDPADKPDDKPADTPADKPADDAAEQADAPAPEEAAQAEGPAPEEAAKVDGPAPDDERAVKQADKEERR